MFITSVIWMFIRVSIRRVISFSGGPASNRACIPLPPLPSLTPYHPFLSPVFMNGLCVHEECHIFIRSVQ